MYLEHFGLTEMPFGITPDTGFTFVSRAHQQALATLLVALEGGEGFVKITGEVGTGKTLLARTLLQALAAPRAGGAAGTEQHRRACVTAYLPNPQLTWRELLRALAGELGLAVPRRATKRDLTEAVEAALLAHAQAGRAVVLVVDEAQALPLEAFEGLRLLSNLETGKRKLLQVVFFGQDELELVLAEPACRSLASRIAFGAELRPLDGEDFAGYLAHRMHVAGWRGPAVFTPLATWLMRLASGGIPRHTNILAHKGLMLAFAAGRWQVGGRDIWRAWRDRPARAKATRLAHPLRPAAAPPVGAAA